ncbi:MAG: hypothetical protein ACE5HS_05185 [bacterium]
MRLFFEKLKILSEHLIILDNTFRSKSNYSLQRDYDIYEENLKRFEEIANDRSIKHVNIKVCSSDKKATKKEVSFLDEIYHQDNRQMKLADMIEFLFFSRGIYFLIQSEKYFKSDRIPIFLELILRFVNLLMVYESLTVDAKLRRSFLDNLKSIINGEDGFDELYRWRGKVGLNKKNKDYDSDAPNPYFDSLLPKTAGGLWHEMLVFSFILKYNIGYIFPLLLNQKPISRTSKLSPPDLIILHHKTYRYYGIEIGNLKERQSGGFMAPSGIPVIPIDTLNARISDRCPSCQRWIGLCHKVIKDFSTIRENGLDPDNEIRCLTDCEYFSLEEKVDGKCLYMKFRCKTKSINEIETQYSDGNHYHYQCCLQGNNRLKDAITKDKNYRDLEKLDVLMKRKDSSRTELQSKLRSKFSYIKTHSVYYSELVKLYEMNLD